NYIKGKAPNPVDTQTSMYADVGVEFLNRAQFQIALPVILGQSTNDTIGADAVSANTSAPMDMRVEGRVVLFRNDARTFRAAVNGALFVPTGAEQSWGGDGKLSGLIGVGAEYDFKSFYVDLNTGFWFRPKSTLGFFVTGNEWRYGLGGFIPLRDNTM